MYKATASALIDAIKANGWKPLPPEQLTEILNRPRETGEEG